ncbi:hypothetical protein PR202_gb25744 [Eleusine coracana subsp. coracana]|uniref:RNase H type-1 domain-containing protein n=1 Tax=Eleusine coracana subsp. coracana TaxID=191504 RepID=A0AAV5FPZ7_ELECO|nr:hypothetical protein PR202_gb25744 [Eleusine coracana subsp. coracana]
MSYAGTAGGDQSKGTSARWSRPRPGRVKVNAAAAFFPDTSSTGVGVVARDERGEVILASGRALFNCADAEEAECLACKEGLNLAMQWIPQPITLEMDCRSVCSALTSDKENRSRIALLLREIKELAVELREVEFIHCYRSQNMVSHVLGNRACVDSFAKVWLHAAPEFVATALAMDCNMSEN